MGGNVPERSGVCPGSSQRQVRVFSFPARTLPLTGEDGPCCLFAHVSGAREFLCSVISHAGGDCHGPVGFPSRLEVASALPSSPFPAATLAASVEPISSSCIVDISSEQKYSQSFPSRILAVSKMLCFALKKKNTP